MTADMQPPSMQFTAGPDGHSIRLRVHPDTRIVEIWCDCGATLAPLQLPANDFPTPGHRYFDMLRATLRPRLGAWRANGETGPRPTLTGAELPPGVDAAELIAADRADATVYAEAVAAAHLRDAHIVVTRALRYAAMHVNELGVDPSPFIDLHIRALRETTINGLYQVLQQATQNTPEHPVGR